MLFFLLRPGRLISLALLVAIGLAGLWAWRRARASPPATLSAALEAVRHAPPPPPGVPLGGVYRLRLHGTERIGIGPARLSRTLPGGALEVVTGTTTGQRVLELRLSADEAESWTVDAGGRTASARSLTVGLSWFSHTFSGATKPPLPLLPASFRTRAWRATYVAADVAFDRRSRIVASRPLKVDGATYTGFLVEATETATGALSGTEITRGWYVPRLGLFTSLKIDRRYDGVIVDRLSATLGLVSATPTR